MVRTVTSGKAIGHMLRLSPMSSVSASGYLTRKTNCIVTWHACELANSVQELVQPMVVTNGVGACSHDLIPINPSFSLPYRVSYGYGDEMQQARPPLQHLELL